MKRALLFALPLSFLFPAFGANDRTETLVHFPSDVSALDPEAISSLGQFIASLDLHGDHEFIVHGHTDSEGPRGYNEQLGLARARSVQFFLESCGVDPRRITVEGFGERRPVVRSATEEGLAINRRVQVVFIHRDYGDLDGLMRELGEGTVQHFTIDPAVDQLIQGANGTSLFVPANAIVDEGGRSVSGPVTVQLTEALEYEAMAAHGLSTRAGDRLLETSGMMKVEAFDGNDRTLQLAPGATMVASLPPDVRNDQMQLFTSATGSDWTATGQSPMVTSTVVDAPPGFNWPMPPFRTYPPFRIASFKPAKNIPHMPPDPVYPREPKEPQADRFKREPAWYQFLWAGRIRQKGDDAYATALARYDVAMERFNKRVAEYEADCASMPERIDEWRSDVDAWHAKQDSDRETWEREVYRPAQERYNEGMRAREPHYDSLMAVYEEELVAAQARWVEYQARWGRYMDSLGIAQRGLVGSYLYSVNSFGWINCDRFYNVPEEKKFEAIVADADAAEEHVYLVFTGINSIIRLPRIDGAYRYGGVPLTEPVSVLGLRVVDGKAEMSLKPLKPFKDQFLEFAPASVAEIRKTMRGLAGRSDV